MKTLPPVMVEIAVRRPWSASALLFLIGPGGAGKSTLGKWLGPALGRTLIDLDEVFLARLGDIGAFIQGEGYAAYKASNSMLAAALVDEAASPALLVTSSGFLTEDNPPDVLAANRSLLARGYSISVMPSSSIDDAVAMLVTRQMSRPYHNGIGREVHDATARARFETYMAAGDLLVCSIASPDTIVEALRAHLS